MKLTAFRCLIFAASTLATSAASLRAIASDITAPPYDLTDKSAIEQRFDEILPSHGHAVAQIDLGVQTEIELFNQSLASMKVFRLNALNFLSDVVKKADAAEVSGEDFVLDQEFSHRLMAGSRQILNYRYDIWSTINKYRSISDIQKHSRQKLYINEKPPWFGWKTDKKYVFDTKTPRGKLLIKELSLGVAAALSLYDNYFLLIESFENIGYVRRRLNHGDQSFSIPSDQLDEISDGIRSFSNRAALRDTLEMLDSWAQGKSKEELEQMGVAELVEIINSSFSASIFRANLFERSAMMLQHSLDKGFFNELRDGRIDSTNSITNSLSKLFGNAVGLVEFRKGKLFNDSHVTSMVRGKLKPLDILLEKTPFRVTDRFIPGHWGHVAIWIGSLDELKKDGTWDQLTKTEQWQSIPADRKQTIVKNLQDGHVILEALRTGVELNSLEHFLNVDDFVALRVNNEMTESDKVDTLARALSHFGKEYDFNFDISTTSKIVCSELAYQTYFGVKWPTEKTLGRYNITPDHVAQLAIEGVPFSVVDLWHDGLRVSGTQTELDYAFNSLMIDSTIQ